MKRHKPEQNPVIRDSQPVRKLDTLKRQRGRPDTVGLHLRQDKRTDDLSLLGLGCGQFGSLLCLGGFCLRCGLLFGRFQAGFELFNFGVVSEFGSQSTLSRLQRP